MDCSTPGLPVPHHLPEFTQVHVHWIGDAIQPSHPLLPPSPTAPNLSQPHALFKWVGCSHHRWPEYRRTSASASVLPVSIKGWFPLGLTGLPSLQSKGLYTVFSNITVQKHQFSLLYGSTLTSIHDYWKDHSFDYKDFSLFFTSCKYPPWLLWHSFLLSSLPISLLVADHPPLSSPDFGAMYALLLNNLDSASCRKRGLIIFPAWSAPLIPRPAYASGQLHQ